ncbi:MAG: N(4)-(beta-N-acetylglucosaminyl)-L-asparaginase, partial [Bacteroidetes bacterium]|nr:N(4)-(beta-N-acetylglucosaminyl)-L-asparaginase [Bacteroidota bacterium]
EAWKLIQAGKRAVDAVEAGVRITESDPNTSSVGYGGFPDSSGKVTLDSCIMDEYGDAGSVACLQHIMNPVSVARKVMEDTPHVMIVGKGAYKFALEKGFKRQNLLTKDSKRAWRKWKSQNSPKMKKIDEDNHDTIGQVALDLNSQLGGACTTSGWAWKIPGRVGDSPIIGAGLYVDNEIGAATATGKGEAVIKIAGTFLVVEAMRNGKSPQEACELAVKRIVEKQKDYKDFQVGFIALNKQGETGGYALKKGFNYALYKYGENIMVDADYYIK